MSRLHVPAVVDVLTVDDPERIAELADDWRMDRDYVAKGPLLNRVIAGRIRKVLAVDGVPLPPVAPRGPSRPLLAQAQLEKRLAPIAAGLANDWTALAAIGAYVRGGGSVGDAGRLAQEAVGRLFDPNYKADGSSWRAALVLDQAPRTFNLILIVWWALTGAVPRARKLLAGKVRGDLSGLHGTGVAVHNISGGLIAMRKLWADKAARKRLTPEAAAAQCLVAPDQVLRQPLRNGLSLAGDFEPTTLVLLQLNAAHQQSPTAEMAFMAQSWSRCPAHAWVLALLAGAWRSAGAEG